MLIKITSGCNAFCTTMELSDAPDSEGDSALTTDLGAQWMDVASMRRLGQALIDAAERAEKDN